MTVAGEIAAFVCRQSCADLPPKTIEYAAMLISSTVASASLGSTLESSRIIRALEVERGGKAEATLWFGAAEKVPVAAAARVNAMMSDAAASDDSDLRNIIHTGTTLCATSLAVAEKTGASGEDVLAAIVLGYEAAGRINGALLDGLQKKGFHGCIVAIFAGAVAAGRLMKLTEAQMAHAIALSATSMGGLHAAARTSVAREYHAGLAAMLGVNDVVDNVFSVEDARRLARFSKAQGLAGLHYWSLDRDTPCVNGATAVSPACSSQNAVPAQAYLNAFIAGLQ